MTRVLLLGSLIALAVLIGACSSTTPTSVAPTVAPAVPVASPTIAPVVAPPTLPTASSSAEAPGAPTPTKFAVALATATNTAVPKPTVPPAPPKPVAATGRIAYSVVTGELPKFFTLWIANVDGSGARQILTHGQWPSLSPDGTRIAYYGRPEGKSAGMYLANSDGGNSILIVNEAGACCFNWSRDGNWIVYTVSNKINQPGGPISTVKMDGAYKTIVSLGVFGNGPAFSPDGKQVVYSGCLPNTNTCGLMIVSSGGGAPRLVTSDNGGNADWSSRGIVYQTQDGAGHRQVFFVNPDGSGKKQLTNGKSNDGQPAWSRDGNFIFWRSDQNGTAWAIYAMSADGSGQHKIIDNVPPHPDLWGWESLSVGP